MQDVPRHSLNKELKLGGVHAHAPIDDLDDAGRLAVAGLVADGLIDGRAAVADEYVVLTLRGRLLADTVVRRLLGV